MNARLKKLQNETFKLKNETSSTSIKERLASPNSMVLASMSDGFESNPGYMNNHPLLNGNVYNNNNEFVASAQNFNRLP
jgi:hypothetical protein